MPTISSGLYVFRGTFFHPFLFILPRSSSTFNWADSTGAGQMSAKNAEIMKAIISTGLHIEYENMGGTHRGITNYALNVKDALGKLDPLTENQWDEVLRDIASYADCLF